MNEYHKKSSLSSWNLKIWRFTFITFVKQATRRKVEKPSVKCSKIKTKNVIRSNYVMLYCRIIISLYSVFISFLILVKRKQPNMNLSTHSNTQPGSPCEMKRVDPHIPLHGALLLLSTCQPLGGGGNITWLLFNVLCKSCGEITQARSPLFVTDGKPFQRDYDALDLLSFSFLLKPRYQLSVSWALDCLDRGARLDSPLTREWIKFPVMTSLSLPFTAIRQ